MHRWEKDDDSCIDKDEDEKCCFTHKLLHINYMREKKCNCGREKRFKPADELYALPVNVEQLILDLDIRIAMN